ncbi:MAG: hypothetical protein IAF94_17720 [Pirellulaceae bacterium]|nr:hypothetical protein [Pirellulaceae bacterium]
MSIGVLCAGCSRPDVPTVPTARLSFERPLVEVSLPAIEKVDGVLRAASGNALDVLQIECGTEIELVTIFRGDAKQAPRILIAEVQDESRQTRSTVKLIRHPESAKQIEYRGVGPVGILQDGRFQVTLRDFGPPPGSPFFSKHIEAR